MHQNRAPFAEDLVRRAALSRHSFHMPGHKHLGEATPRLRDYWGAALFRSDLAEMSGVDYLAAPTGPLAEAQALAAEAFGADATFFLVNGSSTGNHASLLAAARPGDKVIVPRASHRSVFAGLMLSGAEPVYVAPELHPLTGLPLATPAEKVVQAVAAHPEAVAVQVTSPTYHGFCSDLGAIARAAHSASMPLLVDEAHGAHFRFHPSLPPAALDAGADVTVQSLHKTAGSLYQSSLLHVRGNLLRREALEQALGLLQSSSPSSLLLASLDEARCTLATSGRELLGRTLRLAEQARSRIDELPGLHCFGPDALGVAGVVAYDPTKLLISTAGLGLTGYRAAEWLAAERSIEIEFADQRHLLCSLTLADTEAEVEALLAGLRDVAEAFPSVVAPAHPVASWPAAPAVALSLREASSAPAAAISASDAEGQVCAESVMLYPPGIPALLPGEVIRRDVLEFLADSLASGAKVVGAGDPLLSTIRVVAQPAVCRSSAA